MYEYRVVGFGVWGLRFGVVGFRTLGISRSKEPSMDPNISGSLLQGLSDTGDACRAVQDFGLYGLGAA